MLFAAAAAAVVLGSSVGATVSTTTRCPLLTAAQYVLPYAPFTKGNKYNLTDTGTKLTCKQAAVYVRELVTQRVKNSRVTGGPKGWTCTASASKTGRAYTGQCSAKNPLLYPNGPGFAWSVG